MRARCLWVLAAAGCTGEAALDQGTHRPGASGATTVSALTANCAQQPDNALRCDCEVQASGPTPLTFHFGSDAEDRTLSFAAAERHRFTVSGLRADTAYTFTAAGMGASATGAFTTGPLPEPLPTLTVTGTPTLDYVFFAKGVFAVVADTAGHIVWYQEVPLAEEPQRGLISGFDWGGDHVALHVGSELISFGLDGTERLHFRRDVDYTRALHHDLFISGDLIYSLTAGTHSLPGGDFVYDGLYVFDQTGVIAEWDHFDHYDETPVWTGAPQVMWDGVFPGAEDVAHGNGVFVADDGTILVSFRKLSAIYALEGVHEPDFGDVRWILKGIDTGDFTLTADPAITDLPDFRGQHHPRLEDGIVTAFDNRTGVAARTVAIDVEAGDGEARIVEVHNLFRQCGIQGSHYVLANGNVLATCATTYEIFEYAGGGDPDAAPVWSMALEGADPWVARGIPVEINPPGW